jgi:DNA-binding CsgD family transcriptional regulator
VLGNDHAAGMAAARNAERLVGPENPFVAQSLATLLTQERQYRQARPLLLRAAEYLEQADPIATQEIVGTTALCLGLQGDIDRGLRLLGRLITAARARVMPGILPLALSMASLLEFWAGRWQQSWAHGTESIRLAEETGQATDSPLAFGLQVEAGMGRVAECREHARQVAESVARTGNLGVASWMHAALGKLELALRNDDAAVSELVEAYRTIPPDTQPAPEWTADLAEALVRSGNRQDGIVHCDELSRWAEENRHPAGSALAARTRILLDPSAAERWHRQAMTWFRRADVPFERARADLYYGEHLRRARRLTDARRHLDRARDQFRRLGADPWTRRAAGELRASGAAVLDSDGATVAGLTPQEMQIALAVADGATNREAAAALLLSPRTVGFHLNNIYRKLGIRSRVELARAVADPPADATVTAGP